MPAFNGSGACRVATLSRTPGISEAVLGIPQVHIPKASRYMTFTFHNTWNPMTSEGTLSVTIYLSDR
jgi:hypothetical protein